MDRILTVGIIQQSNGADVADNRNRLVAKIRELAADGAQLVVLQEQLSHIWVLRQMV